MGAYMLLEINGLPDESMDFHWDLGKEFFESFGNADIMEAKVGVDVRLVKSGDFVGVDVSAGGSVTVPCDRCLAPLEIPVDEAVALSVKFGPGEPGDTAEAKEGGREIVYLADRETALDLDQTVYDYVCLAVPMKRVHPEGGCDASVTRFIGKDSGSGDASSDNPFAALKDMLEGK